MQVTKYKQETVKGEQEVVQTFIIRNKETKEVWKADSGKSSWKKPAHAKNAWKGSSTSVPEGCKDYFDYFSGEKSSYKETVRFDDQDMFEIVELLPEQKIVTSGADSKLGKIEALYKVLDAQYGNPVDWHDLHPEDYEEACLEVFNLVREVLEG